jgi:hypothetical protein
MPLRANERDIRSRISFDFGERLCFDAATVTKIKISPRTPYIRIKRAQSDPLAIFRQQMIMRDMAADKTDLIDQRAADAAFDPGDDSVIG